MKLKTPVLAEEKYLEHCCVFVPKKRKARSQTPLIFCPSLALSPSPAQDCFRSFALAIFALRRAARLKARGYVCFLSRHFRSGTEEALAPLHFTQRQRSSMLPIFAALSETDERCVILQKAEHFTTNSIIWSDLFKLRKKFFNSERRKSSLRLFKYVDERTFLNSGPPASLNGCSISFLPPSILPLWQMG